MCELSIRQCIRSMHLVRVFRPIGEGAVPGGAGETELAPPTLARRGEGSRREEGRGKGRGGMERREERSGENCKKTDEKRTEQQS